MGKIEEGHTHELLPKNTVQLPLQSSSILQVGTAAKHATTIEQLQQNSRAL